MNRFEQVALGDLNRRDDRILPVTRLVGAIIAPVLLAAFVILWVFPDRTTQLFAWTIAPEMTPIVMGAGYGTGVYFFYRVVTVGEWHRVAHVFPGIAVFTWFMAAATGLHWENFNHSHVSFWAWTLLYVLSPIIVPGLWILNQRTLPSGGINGRVLVPRVIRWIARVGGVVITVTAVILFFIPEVMIETWPWNVSPLTTRVLLGWFVLLGVVNLSVSFDAQWSAWRILMHSQMIGLTLVLLGVVRAWSNFDHGSPYTLLVVGGMAVYLLGVIGCYIWMETGAPNDID